MTEYTKRREIGAEFKGDLTVAKKLVNDGAAIAWVVFDATQSPPEILAQMNVSDILDNAVGSQDIVFTEALPNPNYAVDASGDTAGTDTNLSIGGFAIDATKAGFRCENAAGTGVDLAKVSLVVFCNREVL